MARRDDIDWRREWIEEQLSVEREWRNRPWYRPDAHADWRGIPTKYLYQEPTENRYSLFVVQTCRWRECGDDPEFFCWVPEDGRALIAFVGHVQARQYAKQQQLICRERLGLVEVAVTGVPFGQVFLVKPTETGYGFGYGREELIDGCILAAFATLAEAELDVANLEREAWRQKCDDPGYFALDWTSLPFEILSDVLLDLGIPPCPPEPEDGIGYGRVCAWWKETAPLLDGVQRERLREVMDRFSNYRVVTVPLAD